MPTYQYACRNCEHRFDAVQGFNDDPIKVCPECEQESLRKLFGNVGVVFKGSGFYRNDSRAGAARGGSGKSPSADKGGSSEKGAASSDKGGDSSASKSESKSDKGSGTASSSSSSSSESSGGSSAKAPANA